MVLVPSMTDLVNPHSSVASALDLRTGGHWLNPWLIFLLRIDDNYCYRIYSSLTAVHCFNNGYRCGKAAIGFERILCGVLVNPFPNKPWFLCVCSTNLSLENSVGKGEIARNKQFLLFPLCFPPILRTFRHFDLI